MGNSFYASFTVTILLAWLPSNFATSESSIDFANIPWPPECKRSYCHKRPDNYPEQIFEKLLEGVQYINNPIATLDPRLGVHNDVGHCRASFNNSNIYLIKDENDRVRLVARTNHFELNFQIEECENPGQNADLGTTEEDTTDIYCYETTVPILFCVLSLDGTKLESAAPSGGLPFSCSAKKIDG